MKKIFLASILLAGMFLGSSASFAENFQQKGFMAPNMGGYHNMKKPMNEAERKAEMEKRKAEIDRRLGVTEEQKAQLKNIHEKAKTEIAPKIKELTEVEHEISVLEKQNINKERYNINTLQSVQLSGKNLEQLRAEKKTLKSEIHKIKKTQFEESQKIFTENQKKRIGKNAQRA